MDKSLYVAMTGAKQNMMAQRIHANNLANVNTIGFRSDFEQARAMPVYGDIHPTRVYSLTENPGTNYGHGPLIDTGRDLDLAIKGDGWFAVQDNEGNEAYTRAGDMVLTSTGLLTNGDGFPVMGNGGPVIIPPAEKIEVGVDGTVSIQAVGQGPEVLAEVNRIKLVNPDIKDLVKNSNGLLYKKDPEIEPIDPDVKLLSGYLEDSNVNPVESLTKILALSRQFDLQVKMMKEIEKNDTSAARLMNVTMG